MTSRIAALGFLLALAACGARSNIDDETAGADGSGGFDGTGGVGATGGVGGVGEDGACDTLLLVGPILEVEHPANHADQRCALVRSSDDGHQITVAFQRWDTTLAAPWLSQVHATLSPWKSWPSGILTPTYTTFGSNTTSTGCHAV